MKIYTKTGDAGQTSLYSGERVSKDDSRIEACGTVDEAMSVIGVAAASVGEDIRDMLVDVQNDLYVVSAELASSKPGKHSMAMERVQKLEDWIDFYQERLPKLTKFILPSGSRAACDLHVARTVVRRLERRVVAYAQPETLAYLNRLSDLLFVLSRVQNQADGAVESSPTY